ncbi:hypothetical protein PROFUN_12264 [Planoprotostelium fungivorum]|uniref:Uncharacterized protein n=1 Tax=Planoprotostelium fungivorum TaxID=1890364 RepID=A0A2P6N833_9EUKA|nr:hypothetical protein PROFUN_12264 [Planoprotostelium fungivorum]
MIDLISIILLIAALPSTFQAILLIGLCICAMLVYTIGGSASGSIPDRAPPFTISYSWHFTRVLTAHDHTEPIQARIAPVSACYCICSQ